MRRRFQERKGSERWGLACVESQRVLGKPDAAGAMRVVLRIEVEGVPEQRKGLGCAWTKFLITVEKIS